MKSTMKWGASRHELLVTTTLTTPMSPTPPKKPRKNAGEIGKIKLRENESLLCKRREGENNNNNQNKRSSLKQNFYSHIKPGKHINQ